MDEPLSDRDIRTVSCKVKLDRDQLTHLFHELGINNVEIENAKSKAETKDFKLQAIRVLETWRSLIGKKKATRRKILEALEECEFIEAKETLDEKWDDTLQGPPAKRSRVDDQQRENLTRLPTTATQFKRSDQNDKYTFPSAVLETLSTPSSTVESTQRLLANCRQRGLQFVGNIPADGNCFFHAVSDQLSRLGLPRQSAAQLRNGVVQFLREHPIIEGPGGSIDFTNTTPDWDGYINSMSKDGTWADHIVLVALANMLKHNIFVVTSSPQGTDDGNDHLWIVGDANFNGTPIRLGHEWENHYRSLAAAHATYSHLDIRAESQHDNGHQEIQERREEDVDRIPGYSAIIEPQESSSDPVNQSQVRVKEMLCRESNSSEAEQPQERRPSCLPLVSSNMAKSTGAKLATIRKILTEATDIICDNLNPETLLRTMKTKGAITDSDAEHVRAKIATDEKAEELLSILKRKPATSYDMFMETLVAKGRADLHEQIEFIEMRHGYVREAIPTKRRRVISSKKDRRGQKKVTVTDFHRPSISQDLISTWKQRLATKYKHDKGKIRFGRGRQSVADIDDIFVDLSLADESVCDVVEGIQEDKSSITRTGLSKSYYDKRQSYKKLESVTDLFTIKRKYKLQAAPNIENDKTKDIVLNNEETENVESNVEGETVQDISYDKNKDEESFIKLRETEQMKIVEKDVHHILLQGPAGSGKTTLISNIAHTWATADKQLENQLEIEQKKLNNNPLFGGFDLVFVIELKKLQSETCLEKAIQRQLLSDASIENITEVILNLKYRCLLIFDGFDEMQSNIDRNILESPLLSECFVIFTTRPHMVDQFCRSPGRSDYAHVHVLGFSSENRELYINKLFKHRHNPECILSLIRKLRVTPLLQTLTSFPILLVMICLLWENTQDNEKFQTMTALYSEAIRYLDKPFQEQSTFSKDDIDRILHILGKPALGALFQNKIQIRADQFDTNILEQSFRLGLTVKEDGELLDDTNVTFIHKTFQEFCASKYLTHIYDPDNLQEFFTELKMINGENVDDMEYLLRFFCGLCPADAVKHIMRHVVALITNKISMNKRQFNLPFVLLREPIFTTKHLRDIPALNENKISMNKRQLNLPLVLLHEAITTKHLRDIPALNDELKPLENNILEIRNAAAAAAFSYLGISEGNCNFSWLQKIEEFLILECTIDAERLYKTFINMKSLTILEFNYVVITTTSVVCIGSCIETLRKLRVLNTTINSCAVISLLSYIPSTSLAEFDKVKVTDEHGNELQVTLSERKNLNLLKHHIDKIPLQSANAFVRLLLCRVLSLEGIEDFELLRGTKGRLDIKDSMESEREYDYEYAVKQMLHIENFFIGEYTLVRLFNSLPSFVSHVLLECVSTEQIVLGSCRCVEKSHGQGYLSIGTVMTLLEQTKILRKSLTITKMVILDADRPTKRNVLDCSVRELRLQCCILSSKAAIELLKCIPPSLLLILKGVRIVVETGTNNLESCQKINQLMRDSNYLDCGFNFEVNINTLITILGCMPPVSTVTLKKIFTKGALDTNMSISHELIQHIEVAGVSLSANDMIRLIGCFPSVSKVTLRGVTITGEVEESVSVSYESIEELNIKGKECDEEDCFVKCFHDNIRANTLIRLLGFMPSVSKVTLDNVAIKEEEHKSKLSYKSGEEFSAGFGSLNTNTLLRLLGCMAPVSSVTLDRVDIEGELDKSMMITCESIKVFQTAYTCISANNLMRLIGCMPSVSKVTLDLITINGEVDESITVSCKSMKELHIIGIGSVGLIDDCVDVTANTLMRMLTCMASASKVTLDSVVIKDKEHKSVLSYKSSEEFSASCGSLNANTLMQLLGCMAPVSSVTLDGVDIEGEVDVSMMITCESIKVFHMVNNYRYADAESACLSANNLMRLIACMPSVSKVTLDSITINGEVDESITVTCKSMKELHVIGYGMGGLSDDNVNVTANTLLRMLACMASASKVTLNSVVIKKHASVLSYKSSEEFSVSWGSSNVNTLMQFLGSMAPVSSVTLNGVDIEGEVDKSMMITYESIKVFHMNGTYAKTEFVCISANNLMRLIGCMPSVSKVTLDSITINGEVDESTSVSCKSIEELHIIGYNEDGFNDDNVNVTANTLMRMLACMASPSKVTLNGVAIKDKEHKSVLSYKSSEEFSASCGSLNAKTLMKLLGCMAPVSSVTLNGVDIEGEVDVSMMVTCGSVKEFHMDEYFGDEFVFISANTLMRLLGSMPSVSKVILNRVNIQDEVKSNISVLFESIEELDLGGVLSANTLMRLLGCLPSVSIVTLNRVDIKGEVYSNISVSCKSIKELSLEGSLSANTLMRLLGSMPSVSKVILNRVDIKGEVDSNISVSCNSIKEFGLGGSLSAKTLMRLLGCLPSVSKVTLNRVDIKGEVDSNISVSCKSSKDLSLGGSLSASTLMRLLGCLPSVSKVTLNRVDIKGEVDSNISVSCKSSKDLSLGGSLSASTLMRLLGCLPSVSKVTLNRVDIKGEVDSNISVSCKSIKEFILGGSLSASTLLKLLSCMLSLTKVILNGVDIKGEVYSNILVSCNSIKEFVLGGSLSAKTLMRLLGCMPSVTNVILYRVYIQGEVNSNISVLCESIKELSLGGSMSANTLMRLLGCMPSVSKVTLNRVDINGEVDSNISVSCKSIKELSMGCSLSANTLMRLLGCMPSVTKVTLNRVDINGEVDSNISVSCDSIREFSLGGSLSANTLMRLLGCMPSVANMTLNGVNMTGELDSNISVLCESIKEFSVEDAELSANTFMKLLGRMSSVSSVVLKRITLKGEVDSGVLILRRSIKYLSMEGFSLSTNTLLRFLTCMPLVSSVALNGVDIEGEVDPTISVLCESVDIFIVEDCSMSANFLTKLLGSMPSVSKVKLGVDIEGEVGTTESVLCGSIKELNVEGCSMSANSLLRLLACMPSVSLVTVDGVRIDGEVDSSICVTCELVNQLNMNRGSLSVNTFMQLIGCMPSVSKMILNSVDIQGEIDSSISILSESIKELRIESMSFSAGRLVRLLGCMSSVSSVNLKDVDIVGEVDESLSCEPMQECHVVGKNYGVDFDGCFYVDMSTNTLMKLLSCIPPASKVTLVDVGIEGELDYCVLSYQSSEEFRANCGSLNANTLMRFLGYMSHVSKVTLNDVVIEGELDGSLMLMRESIKEFSVKGGSLSASTLMRLLGCMSQVTEVTLIRVDIHSEVDSNISVSCEFIREFRVRGSLSENTLIRLLGCMPCVSKVTFGDDTESEMGSTILSVTGYSLGANSLMRLLGCLPLVSEVKLNRVCIKGEIESGISASFDSIKKFSLISFGGPLSENTLIRLLSCMPSISRVTLGGDRSDIECGGGQTIFSVTEVSLSANVLVRLLGCLSLISKVRLNRVCLKGEIDSSIAVACKSVKEFSVVGLVSSLSENTLIRLLGCMPSVLRVALGEDIEGMVGPSMFSVTGHSLSANFLMRLLGCVPLVSEVRLNIVCIQGEMDSSIPEVSRSIKEYKMIGGSLGTNTLIRFLNGMSFVSSVTLNWVEIHGELDPTISVLCESIKQFSVEGSSLGANTLMRFLGCMPSVSKVILKNTRIEGEIDANTSVVCESINEFRLKGGAIRANTLMRLLGSITLVSSLMINGIDIKGDVDASLASRGSPAVLLLMRSLGCIPPDSVSLVEMDEVREEEDESMSE